MSRLKQFFKDVGILINGIIPKNKYKILFESNSDFCDNSRAVYDYLIKNNYQEKYKFVWCVQDKGNFTNSAHTKFTSFRSRLSFFNYAWHIITAKFVFYSHYVPPFSSTRSQTIVNLWHGTPLKTLTGYVHPAKLFTYLLTPSEFYTKIMAESFYAPKEKLVCTGYPRTDLLFDEIDVLKKLDINRDDYKKVLLWMPTFRKPVGGRYVDGDVTQTGLPLVPDDIELYELNDFLEQNSVLLLIKLHPGQDISTMNFVSMSHIIMLTNTKLFELGIQLYHMVNNADCLLTDYSSIYFDYLLLNRPIGFIIDDMEKYNAKRGFVVDDPLDLMPGVHIETLSELYEFIEQVGKGIDKYEDKRKKVLELTNYYKDNKSCERVVKLAIND